MTGRTIEVSDNFIENALRFTPIHGEILLKCSLYKEGRRVLVSATDNMYVNKRFYLKIIFCLIIGMGVIVFLFGCQGNRSFKSPKTTGYRTALQSLERVQRFMGQGKYESALSENAKLESYYDYTESRSSDYDRVIRLSARMNTILLEKSIQDEKKIFKLSKKVGEQDVMLKKMNAETDKVMKKAQELDSALKRVERLDTENRMLRQQIKDFKKIDLEGHEIKVDME